MTPTEKAKELFNKYFSELRLPSDCEGCMQCVDRCGNMVAVAKKYALIAVDEILTALDEHQWQNRNVIEFYFYVKQDIEKL